jgi:hypothetical protein
MTTRINPVAAMLAVGVGLSGWAGPARAEAEPFGRLDVGQVEAMLGRKDVLVFDVNSAALYAEKHLPGARWSAMDEVERKLPADKGLTLVYYCHNER